MQSLPVFEKFEAKEAKLCGTLTSIQIDVYAQFSG